MLLAGERDDFLTLMGDILPSESFTNNDIAVNEWHREFKEILNRYGLKCHFERDEIENGLYPIPYSKIVISPTHKNIAETNKKQLGGK